MTGSAAVFEDAVFEEESVAGSAAVVVASRTIADREMERIFLAWQAYLKGQQAFRWRVWVQRRRLHLETRTALQRQLRAVRKYQVENTNCCWIAYVVLLPETCRYTQYRSDVC